MADFNSDIGKTILLRLRDEEIIWLTTVDKSGRPQPRPVWFHWDGETVMILSRAKAAKVGHIQRNPAVALNFNTDEEGGSVGVILGEAQVAPGMSDERKQAYLGKYQAGIRDLGLSPEQMLGEYSVVILVKPTSVRGF
jgi:PPOX class probable F420-dependent enzyme